MSDGMTSNISEKRILFLYHNSDVIIQSTLHQLISLGFKEEYIDYFNVFQKRSSANDVIFSKLSEHTYNYLIIEGNLGFPGENNTTLSDPVIEYAVSKNKEINILIITSTTKCVIELFKKHTQNKEIYYIITKGCPTEAELEQLKSCTNNVRVFKNFREFYSQNRPQTAAQGDKPDLFRATAEVAKKFGRETKKFAQGLKRSISSSSLLPTNKDNGPKEIKEESRENLAPPKK